jgi:hypothetical protein
LHGGLRKKLQLATKFEGQFFRGGGGYRGLGDYLSTNYGPLYNFFVSLLLLKKLWLPETKGIYFFLPKQSNIPAEKI